MHIPAQRYREHMNQQCLVAVGALQRLLAITSAEVHHECRGEGMSFPTRIFTRDNGSRMIMCCMRAI